jgi:hypothetical protein
VKTYGRGRYAQSPSHRHTDEQTLRRLVSRQDFIQTCQDNPQFSLLHFLFRNVENALKGTRFQDAEGITISMTTELNAILGRRLLTVSKNILNDSTNIFKWTEITLNTNKSIFSRKFRNFIRRPCMYNIQNICIRLYI